MIMELESIDIVIVSYPKSGSTLLKFLLANIFFDEIEHNFDSVEEFIPYLDLIDNNYSRCYPQFFKSHSIALFSI